MNLRAALLGCSTGQLARIAAAWRLPVEAGTLRRELVESVAGRIEDAIADAGLWAMLGATATDVMRLLVRAGGRHEAELAARRATRSVQGYADADAPDAVAEMEQAVSLLLERGLLVRTFNTEEQQRGIYLVVPDEVLVAARTALGHVAAMPFAPAESPTVFAVSDLAGDLFVLGSALRREAWSAASRGLAGRSPRSVDQILARLRRLPGGGPGDPGRRWRFLLWVAQRAGWFSRDRLPTPDDDRFERLLAEPDALPALALAAGPVSTDGAPATPDARSGARQRQADALHLLSELDGDSWWDAGTVATWLADTLSEPHGRDSQAAPRNPRDRARERLEAQFHRWLVGRWFWLGLVDWGHNAAGWAVLRPTPFLRALATGRAPASRPSPVACTLATDGRLELLAPPGVDLQRMFRAERYLAFGGGGVTEPRRYGLTPASVDRGVRLGGDADELQVLLERLTQRTLPTAWTAAIQRWLDDASRLRLTPRLVLSSARPGPLAEALAIPAAREAVIETVSPRHALVAGPRVAELLAELAQAGQPVEVDAGLRAEPSDSGRAAALANGVAETAWVALEVLRRLAPDVIEGQRDFQAARGQLDAVLPAGLVESLHRRAASIVAAMALRKRPPSRPTRPRVV
jgi:hypothetical protein